MKSSNTADRLKELLIENRMTQTELAKRTGLSKATINQYILGDNLPRQKNLVKLAQALNTDEAYLMGYDNEDIIDIRKVNKHADNLNKAIGMAMKNARQSKRITVDEMAKMLDRKVDTIIDFEENKKQIIALTIIRYCWHLDYPVEDMLKDILFIYNELEEK